MTVLDFSVFAGLVETVVQVLFAVVMFMLVWAVYRKLADAVVLLQFIRDHIQKEDHLGRP